MSIEFNHNTLIIGVPLMGKRKKLGNFCQFDFVLWWRSRVYCLIKMKRCLWN